MTRNKRRHFLLIMALGLVLVVAAPRFSRGEGPLEPTRKDKCPVCGMFVYKYPDWLAEAVFKDGSVKFFDGAKDLFKYYFNIPRYSPGQTRKDVEAIFVREYYDMKMMNAREAFFVVGSDIYGPMGHELVPLGSLEDAGAFMGDHKGKRILRFEDVTSHIIEKLD